MEWNGEGEAVEHAVAMKRFPEERLVSRLLRSEEGREEIGHARVVTESAGMTVALGRRGASVR